MHHNKILTFLLLILTSLSTFSLDNWSEDDLLMPDQAFQIQGRADGPEHLIVEWQIADGYYMYRDKIRFESDTLGIDLDEPDLPEAKIKHDEFFGDVAIYRNFVTTRIPIQRSLGSPESISLQAHSQGCADQGICFPPHQQQILLALEPVPGSAIIEASDLSTGSPARALDSGAGGLFDSDEDAILPPDEAYQLSAVVEDGKHLRLLWNIAEGTYLYHDKIKLQLTEAAGVAIGDYQLPDPEIKKDSVKPDGTIGDVAVYHQQIDLQVPLVRSSTGTTSIVLEAAYQGCAELGICYPPINKQFTLTLPGISDAEAAEQLPLNGTTPAALQATEPLSEVDEIAATLAGSSTLAVIGVFFLLGLGLAFTPCIFPMIPILSGIIAGQGKSITTRKAFILSLVYVLAMALTYTVAGVLAGLFRAASSFHVWLL